MIQYIKPIKKISVKETLLSIPEGSTALIKTRDIKANTIRSIIRVLNNEGHSFVATEKGLVNEVYVTRYPNNK